MLSSLLFANMCLFSPFSPHYFDNAGISKSLTAAERNRLGLRADDEHGEGRQAGLNAKEFLGKHAFDSCVL